MNRAVVAMGSRIVRDVESLYELFIRMGVVLALVAIRACFWMMFSSESSPS